MLALGPDTRMQDIYFCGTQAQWDAIGKTNNNNFIAGKTVHYVAGIAEVRILDAQGACAQGSSVQMEANRASSACSSYFQAMVRRRLTRSVEWFCVAPGTPAS